jgi:aminoglycoside phosphotransferase (APT) family kinase protein
VLIDAQRRASITAVCHGDAWSANVLFQPDAEAPDGNSAYLIDWQFAMWGNPLTDVALLLWSSLDVGDRRAWLDDLLRHYHQTLTAHTTVNYPAAACRDDYAVAEPYAVLVALATVETYVEGMNAGDLHQFEPRLLTLLNRLSGA